jgi:hypothetical protein
MNCTAKKKSGEPCGAVAVEGGLCAFHRDPERAAVSANRRATVILLIPSWAPICTALSP